MKTGDGQRHAEKVRKLHAEVADLKARLRCAKTWVGKLNGMGIVLDRRVKEWEKRFEQFWSGA